jgi:hypothetical protein
VNDGVFVRCTYTVCQRFLKAYQFDTLPIRLESVDQLKPGDLIFYAGEYTSTRSKVQKHDMTHVEIFYGGDTGEATIGARFSKGVVQIWPSYKFDSSLWKLHTYYFCSIDTWLEGECVSHCAEHEWKCSAASLALAAGERSIFNDTDDHEDKESDDESAGDGDLSDDEASNMDGCVVVVAKKDAPKEKATSKCKATKTSKMPRKSTTFNEKPEKPEKVDNKNKFNNVNSYYVCKSNGWKLVVAALDKRGWHQMPFDYSFSTRYTLKWVERRSQIDYKAHHAGQLVNHIINNDVLTTKNGLLSCLREFYCNEGSTIPSSFEGEEEVASVLTQLMHRQPIDASFSCPRIPTPWLPESYQLDSVLDCVALLMEDSLATKGAQPAPAAAAAASGEEPKDKSHLLAAVQDVPAPPFTPASPSRTAGKGKIPTHLWIYKPSASNRGRGVKMVQGGKDLIDCIKEYHPILFANGIVPGTVKKFERPKLDFIDEDMSSPKGKGTTFALPPPKAMIQHYLMNPLLVEEFKFDMRCYMLITRTSPTYKAYYHAGYCRYCICSFFYFFFRSSLCICFNCCLFLRRTLRKFSLDVDSLHDDAVHLSNVAVQKKIPEYKQLVASQVG